MDFHYEKLDSKQFTLYPIGDWHMGSAQCNEDFIRDVIEEKLSECHTQVRYLHDYIAGGSSQ